MSLSNLRERLTGLAPVWFQRVSCCFSCDFKKKVMTIIYVLIALWTIFGVLMFASVAWIWFHLPQNMMSVMKPECIDDGFRGIAYLANDSYGYPVVKRFKFHVYHGGPEAGSELKFTEAFQFCRQFNATLWEVEDEAEWEALIGEMTYYSGGPKAFWLNGMTTNSSCPTGEECLKEEAKTGQGLPVVWRSDRKSIAKYSRLYKGEIVGKHCVYVEDSSDQLWSAAHCNKDDTSGVVCIKRNCFA